MFRSFSQNFPLGAPGHCGQYNISKNLEENRVQFPEERIVFVLGHQHGLHDVTCEPVTETRLYSFTVRFVDVQNVKTIYFVGA